MHAASMLGLEDELQKIAADLTANARDKIKGKNFALPGRRYPIEDEAHARNALARVSQHGTPEEKETVRRKVMARWPGVVGDETKKDLEKKSFADQVAGYFIGKNQGKKQKGRKEPYSFGGKQGISLLIPGGVGYQIGRHEAHHEKKS